MAKFILVNEQDEVIGSTQSKGAPGNEIHRVAALWLTNSQGDILLARRSITKRFAPGKWGPSAAGTVEVGESYEENIKKEIDEELGLRDLVLEKKEKVLIETEHRYFCQWFTASVDKKAEEFEIQEEEVIEVRWFSIDEIKKGIEETPEMFTLSIVLGSSLTLSPC